MGRLVINGEEVYELDEECLREKNALRYGRYETSFGAEGRKEERASCGRPEAPSGNPKERPRRRRGFFSGPYSLYE